MSPTFQTVAATSSRVARNPFGGFVHQSREQSSALPRSPGLLAVIGGLVMAAVVAGVLTVRVTSDVASVVLGAAAVLAMSTCSVRPIRGRANAMWMPTGLVHLGLCLIAGPCGGLTAALADALGGVRRSQGLLSTAAEAAALFLANLTICAAAQLMGVGRADASVAHLALACLVAGLAGFVAGRGLLGLVAWVGGRVAGRVLLRRSLAITPYAAGFSATGVGFVLLHDSAGAVGVAVMLMPVLLVQGFLFQLSRSLAVHEAREAGFAAEREQLLRQTIDASDRERQRLAGDLHDGVIQLICAVTIRAATLARALRRDGGPGGERLAHTLEGLDRITSDLQAATADLRSLMGELANSDTPQTELNAALSQLLAPLAEQGIDVEISVGEIDCDDAGRSLIYRVAQELVRNVAKHARATLVVVRLGSDLDGIRLTVSDNGGGFRAEDLQRRRGDGSLGLGLLEQRVNQAGGRLRIESVPGHGTTAEALIPAQESGLSGEIKPSRMAIETASSLE